MKIIKNITALTIAAMLYHPAELHGMTRMKEGMGNVKEWLMRAALGDTRLLEAARRGDVSEIKRLLVQGVDVNVEDVTHANAFKELILATLTEGTKLINDLVVGRSVNLTRYRELLVADYWLLQKGATFDNEKVGDIALLGKHREKILELMQKNEPNVTIDQLHIPNIGELALQEMKKRTYNLIVSDETGYNSWELEKYFGGDGWLILMAGNAAPDLSKRITLVPIPAKSSYFFADRASAFVPFKDGNSPLHIAIMLKKLPLAKRLIEFFPEFASVRNDLGQTPLELGYGLYGDSWDTFINSIIESGYLNEVKARKFIYDATTAKEKWEQEKAATFAIGAEGFAQQ